jgi:hypothetical protein
MKPAATELSYGLVFLIPLWKAAAGTDGAWVLRLLMAKECDAAALCVSFPCRTSRGEDDRPALVDMAYRTLAHMLAPKDTDRYTHGITRVRRFYIM